MSIFSSIAGFFAKFLRMFRRVDKGTEGFKTITVPYSMKKWQPKPKAPVHRPKRTFRPVDPHSGIALKKLGRTAARCRMFPGALRGEIIFNGKIARIARGGS